MGRPARPDRKEQILQVASDLFHQSGFDRVGIDEIGEAVGVTGPAIYFHFKNKEGLLVALMERAATALTNLDESENSPDGPETALHGLIDRHIEFALNNRGLISVWAHEHRSLPPQHQEQYRQTRNRYVSRWVDKIVQLRSDIDRDEATFLVNGAIHLVASSALHKSRLSRDRQRDLLRSALLGLLVAPR